MTLLQRFRSVFRPESPAGVGAPAADTDRWQSTSVSLNTTARAEGQTRFLTAPLPDTALDPAPPGLPDWLADEEALRDEGVLFGLSDAQPDEKMAGIRAYFAQQSVPLTQAIGAYSASGAELDRLIDQYQTRLSELRARINELYAQQPTNDNLIRTIVGLGAAMVMGIGIFYLIDQTIRPVFPNRWIGLGIFLTGLFAPFGRESFLEIEAQPLTGRRLLTEVGTPLAAAGFVLVQALRTQSVWQAGALFGFVFFGFLLAGKLMLNSLTTLGQDLSRIRANRQLVLDKQQLPALERQSEQLSCEIDALWAQKRDLIAAKNPVDAALTQLNARRDGLVQVFLSEFKLARSLRDRLTEQQREAIFT